MHRIRDRPEQICEKEIISHFIRISHVSAVTGRNVPVPDYAINLTTGSGGRYTWYWRSWIQK
jgi:hypothetical protein